MLTALKSIWQFAGTERANANKSLAVGFLYAIFHMLQVGAIYQVILALTGEGQSGNTALTALALLMTSILGRTVCNYFGQLQQTHAGYFMVGNKRVSIGDRLKSVPMGYFNDNSLGEITGITTTVLEEVETTAPMVLVGMLGGFINALVFTTMVLVWDWRIGLIVAAATVLYLLITSAADDHHHVFPDIHPDRVSRQQHVHSPYGGQRHPSRQPNRQHSPDGRRRRRDPTGAARYFLRECPFLL